MRRVGAVRRGGLRGRGRGGGCAVLWYGGERGVGRGWVG